MVVKMSNLIDKLNQLAKPAPQPMGFTRTYSAQAKPKPVLIAGITKSDELSDIIAGADAGLLHIANVEAGVKDISKAHKTARDLPWGGWLLEDSDEERVEAVGDKIAKAGADFVVFPPNSTLTSFLETKLGKILEIDPDLDRGMIAALNDLPVNAVLINQKTEQTLTWHDLMAVQQAANLLTKPLLITVSPDITSEEIQALWDAGVYGIVVSAQSAGKIQEIRQIIDSATFAPRKRMKSEALLPHMTTPAPEPEEEEEGDGDE
jgi:hypothetical protein